jgi:predicted AlkP superfamily pyrophosphatase or phosphodiesterase
MRSGLGLESSTRSVRNARSSGPSSSLVLLTLFTLSTSACHPPQAPRPQVAGPASVPTASPSAAPPASTSPSVPHRVILVSLDGASSQELHRLHREGAFSADGFERFFRDGAVSEGMVPVNPTLTSVNHISLATGATADKTGIVGNTYHPAGAEWGKTVSGFAADIGAETLWEAAKRQGKRVGVTTWPGADGLSERRKADWGMFYVNDPDRPSDLASLDAGQWQASAGTPPVKSRSPLRTATVASAPARGAEPDRYELFALDRTDDGKTDYDALAIRALPSGEPVVLARGAWSIFPCSVVVPGEEGGGSTRRRADCPVKVVDLDPDLAHVTLYFGAVYPLKAYPEGFAANLEERGLVWPGPPDDRRLEGRLAGRPGIDLETWNQQSAQFARFFGEAMLAAVARSDWDLLMSYVPVIDEAGHQLLLTDPRQREFSEARKRDFEAARRQTWQAVDREIARLLAAVDLQRTTVVLVADHGMTPIHTALDANVLLREKGLLVADAEGKVVPAQSPVIAVGGGGICHVYVQAGRQDLLPQLRALFSDWRIGGESPIEKIVSRAEAGELGLNSPNSGDLLLFAQEGYSFHLNGLKEGRAASPSQPYGMHGFLNHHADIHPIYLAIGAGVTKGDTRKLRSIDVAARVAAWIGMKPPGAM